MPTFVQIERLENFVFQEVEYFSVRDENLELCEFERFLVKHMELPEIETEFGDLLAWLERLGMDGAEQRFFRHEQRAQALPPPLEYLGIDYEKHLRLYCLRLSDRAVFLFSGGIKSAARAQDCPNVAPHFYNAQQYCKKIKEMLDHKELILEPGTEQLFINTEGFYL